MTAWISNLRPLCKEACVAANSAYPVDVVLFYLARWCQKATGEAVPQFHTADDDRIREVAGRIVRNVAEDGGRVERLFDGDREAWTELRGVLLTSTRRRGGAEAVTYADEALQKIALVLLTGTPPSRAAEQLRRGPDGPANEYVFQSPFTLWARSVAINLIVDEQRREKRRAQQARADGSAASTIERAELAKARDALPGLLEAVRELPPVQRAVMVESLARADLDEEVRERLHELAPDLFSDVGAPPESDREIAEHLGTTARLVAANRSAARRKLARRDPLWALLLDALLPHRSTRPLTGAPASGPSEESRSGG